MTRSDIKRNRRIHPGTYGGVGGRGREAPPTRFVGTKGGNILHRQDLLSLPPWSRAGVSTVPPTIRSARTTDQSRSTTPGPCVVYEFSENAPGHRSDVDLHLPSRQPAVGRPQTWQIYFDSPHLPLLSRFNHRSDVALALIRDSGRSQRPFVPVPVMTATTVVWRAVPGSADRELAGPES